MIQPIDQSKFPKDSICHPNRFPGALIGKLVNKACNCSDISINGLDGNVGDIDWFVYIDDVLDCRSTDVDSSNSKYTHE